MVTETVYILITDPNRNIRLHNPVPGGAKLPDEPIERGEAVTHRVICKNPDSS